jgi:hypothetical protein
VGDARNVTLRVMHAVAASDLRPEVRHLVMTMALLATGKTGVGTSSQATIGKAMGISDRHVRNLLAELEANPLSPVRVERRRRGRAGGTGRTSDEYQLILVPEAERGFRLSPHSTGNGVPLEPEPQPEKTPTSTGTPEHLNRNPSSDDQRSDQRRLDQRSTSVPSGTAGNQPSIDPSKKKRSRKPKAQTDLFGAEPGSVTDQLKEHYIAELLQHRKAQAKFKSWSRAMKAFRELGELEGLDGGKLVITNALADEYCRRIQPWELVDDSNKHKGNGRGPKRVGPPQEANEQALNAMLAREQAQGAAE